MGPTIMDLVGWVVVCGSVGVLLVQFIELHRLPTNLPLQISLTELPGKRCEKTKLMLEEVFLFRKLLMYNKRLWPFTLLFHWGVYLLLLKFGLDIVGCRCGTKAGPALQLVGGIAGVTGAAGLIYIRLKVSAYRITTSFMRLVVLIMFLAVFVATVVQYLISHGQVKGAGINNMLPWILIIFALAIVISTPFAGIAHFLAKYFAYHKVLMSTNSENNKLNLRRQVTWKVPYLSVSPSTTWQEILEHGDGDAFQGGGDRIP